MKIKLNLGCGEDTREGYLNVDIVKGEEIDIVHNLNIFPYPFKDNSVDEIVLQSCLEHLNFPEEVIYELHRILKVGGILEVLCPHFSSFQAFGNIQHKRSYAHGSMNSFKDIFKVNSNIDFDGIFKWMYWFVNRNNFTRGFYEKHFAYIFPASNVYFKLIKLEQSK